MDLRGSAFAQRVQQLVPRAFWDARPALAALEEITLPHACLVLASFPPVLHMHYVSPHHSGFRWSHSSGSCCNAMHSWIDRVILGRHSELLHTTTCCLPLLNGLWVKARMPNSEAVAATSANRPTTSALQLPVRQGAPVPATKVRSFSRPHQVAEMVAPAPAKAHRDIASFADTRSHVQPPSASGQSCCLPGPSDHLHD